jgi:demethylmenaquinone methyltransferase/2-methoxy-6-polyprenyl-1,4-benzoquinol methylase
MALSYALISKSYRLLDSIYFRQNNPRTILMQKIPDDCNTVLEIAVGTAENSILLAKNKPNVHITGIDISEHMLNIARNGINKENLKNIALINMDASNMSFEKTSFDVIIISLLLHELSEGLADKILTQCLHVLKNDGKIFVLEWEYPKKFIQKIFFSVINLLEPLENREYKQFMKKDLNVYFNKNGFQIKNIDYGDYTKIIQLEKLLGQ